MSDYKNILIAIAWPYVNGDIHVGHLAGYLLPADIMARFQRLRGNDVLMVSGSDCYGTPITVEADKQKLTPQEVVDIYHPKDVALFKQYNFSYNLYTKTMTENHKEVVQEVFVDLLKNDFIVKDTMKQYYSEVDDQFLPDRYVEGTCPHCKANDQRSDQCESCGRWLSDGELIDPRSKLTGSEVILKDTEHYFLDFTKAQEKLEKYVDSKEDVWRNWIWKESNGWLKEGLRKRAITRDLDWGIELPVEEIATLDKTKQLSDYEGKRIYVWFEAVIGYLSASKEWSILKEAREDVIFLKTGDQDKEWEKWWHNDDAVHYYFMGQDNLVFHTLMWPGELIGTGKDYQLPHNVLVNKFMNYEGKKFSKSRNWTIDSKKIAEKYGVDQVRYYIAANLPENKEANFTWDGFVDAINNELVANLGNLINRTLKFLESKFDGKITQDNFEVDGEIKKELEDVYSDMARFFDKGEFVYAIERLMKLAKFGNKYFENNKVWEVLKTDEEKAKEILLNLLNIIDNMIVLINPFVPESSEKLERILEGGNTVATTVGNNLWTPEYRKSFILKEQVEILFPKLDKEVVLEEKEND